MLIETGIKGLSVSIGAKGVWINTKATTKEIKLSNSINLTNFAKDVGGHGGKAILEWCEEVTEHYSKNPQPIPKKETPNARMA